MSLHPNWVALTRVHISWKTFVRETNEQLREPKNTFPDTLNFEGTEARTAYEEVIRELPKTNLNVDAKLDVNSNHPIENVANQPPTPRHGSEKVATSQKPISINTILKAVEQNDMDFLTNNLTTENVDICDDFGWTPLMSAAYCGHLEIIEFLLKLGANRKVKEKSGLTAAQLALKKNRFNVVALLRRKRVLQRHDESSSPIVESSDMIDSRTAIHTKSPFQNGEQNYAAKCELDDSVIEFFCEICDRKFKETTIAKHESSTLHIFNTKPKVRGTAYGIPKRNKGYQMLLNTGWDEDTGLGPCGDGLKYPVKTVLKRNRKGLGCEKKEARITHFDPKDIGAVMPLHPIRQRTMKKKDREKLLSREAMREQSLRAALS